MKKIVFLLMGILLISNIIALDTRNENRLSFGHILLVKNVTTEPSEIVPGNDANLKVVIINNGDLTAKDIRVRLNLPAEVSFFNDISEKKTSTMMPDQQSLFEFNIITLPKTAEGVYKASITVDYVNNIGENRQDNYSIGIVVKSTPKIFGQIEKTDIYNEKRTGDLSLMFTNNDVANIKFLTTEILESEDYEIISSNKKYIGDLDSNDFQSVDFTIKVKDRLEEILIPVKITYKDSLNKDYSEEMKLPLKIRTAKELGISNNNYYLVILALILLVVVVIYIYKKKFAKKRSEY